MYAVETINLSRVFELKGKSILALDDVSIRISKGEILGLLGANGAGKTTLVKILSTLLLPSKGSAYIHGYDVVRDAKHVRRMINLVSGGETPGYGMLTVRENLWFFSQLYGLSSSLARERIEMLIKDMELEQYRDVRMHKLSTGYKQRLNLARGFINDPRVLFLDEPTLGLDVINARHMRKYIRDWVDEDRTRTILLTTHYLAEAEEVCDKIAIIYKGRIVAYETPLALKASLSNGVSIQVEILSNDSTSSRSMMVEKISRSNGVLACMLEELGDGDEDDKGKMVKHSWSNGYGSNSRHNSSSNDERVTRLRIMLDDDSKIPDLVSTLVMNGYKVLSVMRDQPTLEDVYMRYITSMD
ncbi:MULTISPECIES: ABC transporter ATP-binding protein [Candidatus Nitrosocaldus]|jgi:ABC-2 type transport system ATP-binding protein|uniref:ATPase component n=1 Tax=Candidatus Nitrosocaldus cavascurensis TaxID=2058097 RepID=A0A2K5AS36_9ARCH|nr:MULTISPECIES: ABC transporter ATP-binding protein [Candidatus Nitrosocaldus]SPC34452.1 ATPase component [Candidatus Nitrosocaldus cavascurensis]